MRLSLDVRREDGHTGQIEIEGLSAESTCTTHTHHPHYSLYNSTPEHTCTTKIAAHKPWARCLRSKRRRQELIVNNVFEYRSLGKHTPCFLATLSCDSGRCNHSGDFARGLPLEP